VTLPNQDAENVGGLQFLNYVLLRLFANRGLYYTAALGGLVNSTATVAELSRSLSGEAGSMAITLVLLTSVAMFLRNLLILAIFAPAAVPIAVWPILAMAAGAEVLRNTQDVKTYHRSCPLIMQSSDLVCLMTYAVEANLLRGKAQKNGPPMIWRLHLPQGRKNNKYGDRRNQFDGRSIPADRMLDTHT
jgi:hypothetical protein